MLTLALQFSIRLRERNGAFDIAGSNPKSQSHQSESLRGPAHPAEGKHGSVESQSRLVEIYCFFGASEATTFSKRGSPRSASHSGSRRSSP
jgi:hypothetical protein